MCPVLNLQGNFALHNVMRRPFFSLIPIRCFSMIASLLLNISKQSWIELDVADCQLDAFLWALKEISIQSCKFFVSSLHISDIIWDSEMIPKR